MQSDVRSRLQKLRNYEGRDGKVKIGLMGPCVCDFFFVFFFFVLIFLINTTMKVGCAEASGSALGAALTRCCPLLRPIHTTFILQCLMYLEKYLDELAEL